jgi:hypothetical protein
VPGRDDGSNFEFHPTAEVIFSLSEGFVWVSWPGSDASVKLGRCQPVTEMMQDFLDQCALGERLARKGAK